MVASPNSHIMIARTLRDKGDIAQAYAEYDRVVVEADQAILRDSKYQATADAARAERGKLREKLTMVIVRVRNPPEDLHVVVGDKPIERTEWGKPVPVKAGALVALGLPVGAPINDKRSPVFRATSWWCYSTTALSPPAPVEATPAPKKKKTSSSRRVSLPMMRSPTSRASRRGRRRRRSIGLGPMSRSAQEAWASSRSSLLAR